MAAAVVAALVAQFTLGGIALGILVGEAAAHGAEHILTNEVLAGDQLHSILLTLLFLGDKIKNLRGHLGLLLKIQIFDHYAIVSR